MREFKMPQFNTKLFVATLLSLAGLTIFAVYRNAVYGATTDGSSTMPMAFIPIFVPVLTALIADIRILGFPKFGYALIALSCVSFVAVAFTLSPLWAIPVLAFPLFLLVF
jgi:hypothetical protein